jgi:hypothetical protein
MNYSKRTYCFLLLILIAAISISACGGGGGTTDTTDTTDTTAPTVITVTPMNNLMDVDRNTAITAEFSEDILGTSLTNTSFLVQASAPVDATVIFDGSRKATLIPDNPLEPLTDYVATLTTAVTDLSGNPLETDYQWSFSTSGDGWQTPVSLEDYVSGDGVVPKIVMNESGIGVAAWRQTFGVRDTIAVAYYTQTNGWSQAELFEFNELPGTVRDFDLAINEGSTAMLVWEQEGADRDTMSLYAIEFTLNNGWGVPNEISSVVNFGFGSLFGFTRPQITLDDNGHSIVVWLQIDEGVETILANSYDPVDGWGTPERIETLPFSAESGPKIDIDDDGNALAVWSHRSSGDYLLRGARYVPTTGWTEPVTIENIRDQFSPPTVAVDGDGNAMVVWTQLDLAFMSVKAKSYTLTDGWGETEFIENSDAGSATSPQIEFDGRGNAIAVWLQNDETASFATDPNIYANHYSPANGWGDEEQIEHTSNQSAGAHTPKIDINDEGYAVAVWRQTLDGKFRIEANRYIPGIGWGANAVTVAKNPDVGSAWFMNTPDLAIDGNGNALSIWSQNTDGLGTYDIYANLYE